jgi:hypothetical protein
MRRKIEAICYICFKAKRLDDHHIDCQEGTISPDTVPLCRRCHRTYHDLGTEWFDDEVLDRAIEVENMRRRIFGEPFLEKRDIVRSDYWYKKHSIKRPESDKKVFENAPVVRLGIEPLCGWPWVEENRGKIYPEQGIVVFFNGKELLDMPSTSTKRGLIRAVMALAKNVGQKKSQVAAVSRPSARTTSNSQ